MSTRLESLFGQALLVSLASALFFAAAAQAQTDDPCDRRAKTIGLKIKEKHNKPTKVTRGFFNSKADTVKACRGDTIEWKLSAKTFVIRFRKETPFKEREQTSKNGKVTMTIDSGAEAGKKYKYDVGIGDAYLDPIIIIDNRN